MTSEIHAAIYGRGADFVVVILPLGRPSALLALEYAESHALPYCGSMSFVRGECRARCEPTAEAVSVLLDAVPAFARYVSTKIKGADAWSALT
jgi:hypothetical protein